MRILLQIIIAACTFTNAFGQATFLNNLKVREDNFFYKDSINGQITYGNYEPTGIISMDDGSLVVSTKFSLSFPGQFEMPITFNDDYFAKQKIFDEKSHISSGSVFKLDNNYQKQWEIIFREKRVVCLKKLSDESILAIGEMTDQKKFWISKISSNGKIIFERSYRLKSQPNVENVEIDSADNIHILISAEKCYPLSITNIYGRLRMNFFKVSDFEHDLYLLKISPAGKIKWVTTLDNRKNFTSYGSNLVINNGIHVSMKYDGFVKEKKERKSCEGSTIFEINNRGKIQEKYPVENKRVFLIDSQIVYATAISNDTLIFYKRESSLFKPIETIVFNDDIKQCWALKTLTTDSNNYFLGTHNHNLGFLLIKLDKQNRFLGYWKNDRVNASTFEDATVKPDNSIVIAASQYSRIDSTDNKSYYSVKLITIK